MNNSYPKSWTRIMYKTTADLNIKKNLTRQDLKRGALALVKGLNARDHKINSGNEADYIKAVWDNFQLYEIALSVIGMLTPQEVDEKPVKNLAINGITLGFIEKSTENPSSQFNNKII